MKIFLDANVLFSASNAGSGIARLVDALCDRHEVISSPYAWSEAERNILVKRPAWKSRLTALRGRIPSVADHDAEVGVVLAAKDRPILATACQQRCHFLVTGDRRDFGHLFGQEVCGVRIFTPLMMAEWLASAE